LPAHAVLAGCAEWQKVELQSAPGPHARTDTGEVKMDAATSIVLAVTEHRARRDSEGRLVVRVEFQNVSDSAYAAKVRAEFADAQGLLEKGAFDDDLRQFPPGTTSVEWRSSTPEAVSYVIEVWSGGAVPW